MSDLYNIHIDLQRPVQASVVSINGKPVKGLKHVSVRIEKGMPILTMEMYVRNVVVDGKAKVEEVAVDGRTKISKDATFFDFGNE